MQKHLDEPYSRRHLGYEHACERCIATWFDSPSSPFEGLGSCNICASAETMAELEQVLHRDKFDRYLSSDVRQDFIRLIRRNVRLFALESDAIAAMQSACRDPKDAPFLALALAAEADILVTSDEDLLVLHPWRGIQVLSPAEFLAAPDLLALDLLP